MKRLLITLAVSAACVGGALGGASLADAQSNDGPTGQSGQQQQEQPTPPRDGDCPKQDGAAAAYQQ